MRLRTIKREGATLGEVADRLGITRSQLQILRDRGTFLPDLPGGRWSGRAVVRLLEDYPDLVPEGRS